MYNNMIDLIPTGKENAITAAEISQLLCNDVREIRQIIHNLRVSGQIICAGADGYYLPDSDKDIKAFYRQMSKRIAETQKALKPVEDYLRVSEGAAGD